MSVPETSAQILSWIREGQARFAGELERLSEAEFRADSALPDWSRAYVGAHVARNAEAVTRLLAWARTGEETPMYPDMETRNRDIEISAQQDAETLRADVADTAARFDAAIEELPDSAWHTGVRTFNGREIQATDVLWMRVREVWLHLVDLGLGTAVESWPGDLVDAVLDDVTTTMSGRDDAPSLRLVATDRERVWEIGPQTELTEISGRAADHLAWLTGRSTGQGLASEGVLPDPPHWM